MSDLYTMSDAELLRRLEHYDEWSEIAVSEFRRRLSAKDAEIAALRSGALDADAHSESELGYWMRRVDDQRAEIARLREENERLKIVVRVWAGDQADEMIDRALVAECKEASK